MRRLVQDHLKTIREARREGRLDPEIAAMLDWQTGGYCCPVCGLRYHERASAAECCVPDLKTLAGLKLQQIKAARSVGLGPRDFVAIENMLTLQKRLRRIAKREGGSGAWCRKMGFPDWVLCSDRRKHGSVGVAAPVIAYIVHVYGPSLPGIGTWPPTEDRIRRTEIDPPADSDVSLRRLVDEFTDGKLDREVV